MYKTILTIAMVLLLCCAVGAQDTTNVEKKYKFLTGYGASVNSSFETAALSTTAFSMDTDVKGTLGMLGMLVPDESYIVYEYAAPKGDDELTATKAASLMGIWKLREGNRFTPFLSLSGTAMKSTQQSTSESDFDVNVGAGTYFKLTEDLGLYMNNVFEVGEYSTYKGSIGIYLAR